MKHRLSSVWIVCVGVLLSGAAMAFQKPPFPRISLIANGGGMNYEDAAIQQRFAKFSFSVLAIFPGWDGAHGIPYEQAVRGIKAYNPNSMVFPYMILQSSYPASSGALPELAAKLDAERWWLYPSGTSGIPVPDPWPGQLAINTTLFTHPDSNGDHYVNWFAKWAIANYYNKVPSMDGFWNDGVSVKPAIDGDYNLDGLPDDIYTAAPWHRQGFKALFNTLRAGMPGKYQLGNIADWGHPNSDLSDYNGMVNGGLIEGLMGYSYSVETWGGWQAMMNWYRKTMAAVADPKLVQFHLTGKPWDYQTMRYALASCLMDDGYFTFSYEGVRTDSPDTYAPWFDEYDANLGYATSAPPTASWQSGVYRRDFENGIALVNPKGNGGRQVFLEADYVKLSGSQAPDVNNGQVVRSVVLNDRDGIILRRVGAAQSASTNATSSSSSSVSSSSSSAASSSSSSSASSASSATSSSSSSSSSATPVTTTSTTTTAPTVTPATAKVPAPPPTIVVQ